MTQLKDRSRKFSAIVIGISLVLIICLASFIGAFQSLNGMIYDGLMGVNIKNSSSEQIMIVEADNSLLHKGDEVWLTALQHILSYGVRQVVFTFVPEQVSDEFYQLAKDSKKVIFGRQVINNADDGGLKLIPLPQNISATDLVFGVVKSSGHEKGVFKYQFGQIEAENKVFPSLEYAAAQQVLGESVQLPAGQYLINFIGGTARLPKLNIHRVLSNGLIEELLKGRTVLVGINDLETIAEFYTPISDKDGLISDLMMHGFALDTLLSERQIESFPQSLVVLFIFLVTVGSLFFSQWLALQLSVIASLVVSLIYLFLGWLALHFFSLLLPYIELFLAQWLTFIIVWRFKIITEQRALDGMLLGLSVKLQERVFPISFYRTEDPWTQLITMINQTLNLNRILFLERVEDDHRLHEIKALHCSIDDIVEMRRDYERTPYSTAISENKVLLLDRPYLNKVDVEELQYLAPLIFAGEVLGFWAFTIESDNMRSKIKFDTLTYDFMQQISEILYYRQEWQRQMQIEQNRLWSYLRIEGGEAPYRALNKSVLLMEKRISILREVFDNMSTCSILYDLFGNVLLVNNNMTKLAQILDIRPYSITMLDFIVAVTDYDANKARKLLQHTIFDEEVTAIPIKPRMSKQSYMLFIRPLKTHEQEQYEEQIIDEANVFAMRGVLCELADISELKQLWGLKEQMLERFGFQLRNQMASMFLALSMLQDETLLSEDKQPMMDDIQNKINETLDTLKLANEQNSIEVEYLTHNKLACYPIDGLKPLDDALSFLQEQIATLAITVHKHVPMLLCLVFAGPYELGLILRLALTVLLEESGQKGNIWLEIEAKEAAVYYRLYNDGAGMPQENLEKFFDSESLSSEEITKLHNAKECVQQWGGLLTISSEVGKGLRVELKLRRFL
ncbi:MAG: CHASE2 domain-containing protein [Methylococcaceae bacterium]|nr:CHASE2 domain-containing protein [Methylococcaceae bacterium]